MAADPMRSKALACLREGRVTVLGVRCAPNAWRPIAVVARVRSSQDRHPYRVRLIAGTWSCTCAAGLRDEPCPHVSAVALVTTAGAAA